VERPLTKHRLSFQLAIASLLLASHCALAQETPYVPTMTFDVASVRVASESNVGIMLGGQFTPHTTHLRLSWTADSLLNIAFGVDRFQLVGAPSWTTVFAIEAKGDADADAKMATLPPEQERLEQRHMLQALMEERFKLKTHWEAKESNTYNLVIAKGGPKLGAEGSMPPSAEDLKIFGDRPVPPLRQVAYDGKPAWIAHGCSMSNWARLLTSVLDRPVIDKTGLTGKYDFVLKYKGRTDQDRSADDTDPTPPMDRALQEQLGLKVEQVKGSVKVLVIDHIEKPSEN